MRILWIQLLPVLLFVSLAAGQQTEQAELTSFSGDVDILLKEADDYVQAEEGMTLEAGDNIRTGSGASAEVSFNEENTNLVRVNENSDLTVTFSGDEKLEMNQGEVFTTISNLPSGSAFEIRTPTAVSGARGTDWVTKVTEEGTDVEAMDSTPYVKHFQEDGTLSKEQTFIIPGKMTSVQKFRRPQALREIPLVRRQQWQSVKLDVRKRGSEALIKRQQRPAFNRKEFMDKRGMMGRGKDGASLDPDKQRRMRRSGEGHRPMLDSKEGRVEGQGGGEGQRRPMMGPDGERFDRRDPDRAGLGDRQQKRLIPTFKNRGLQATDEVGISPQRGRTEGGFIEGEQARQKQGLNDRPGQDSQRLMRQHDGAGDFERKSDPTFDGKGRFKDERTQEKRRFQEDDRGSFGTPSKQGAKGGNSRSFEGRRPPMRRGGMGQERKSPGGMQRR